MILWMAEKDEDTVRGMFRELYDLTIDFKVRIENFREKAKLFVEMYKEKMYIIIIKMIELSWCI